MKSTNKYICIHGHFYQPPRENAWLEVVETQHAASPYHDWNERINDECYRPNTCARILDENGLISEITNNYAKISFNFGPTLLSWLQANDAACYHSILEADKIAQQRFGGFGSAIAQVYNHVIMPLANRQDKITQVAWGIRDFENRFGRKPDGMWLAETAVDTETLEILADFGIKSSILSPRQIKAFRKSGNSEWTFGTPDSRKAYRVKLPSGKSIGVFVYDGDASHSIAFNGLLNSGKAFAAALLSRLTNDSTPELVNVATDGESYGHHHRHGEMALADCLQLIENMNGAQLCNYAQFLHLFPPEYELEILENSSWSCAHGIERWRSDCGCGEDKGYHLLWRAPLRDALNWLRDELLPFFEAKVSKYLPDVWAARNAYIDVLMDRSPEKKTEFLRLYARETLNEEEIVRVFRLMEMQRNTMLMFTCCGWFFEEVSRIETRQILQYACRAIDYAIQLQGPDLNSAFEKKLAEIPSNKYENCAVAYRKLVLPTRFTPERICIHVVAAALFEKYPESFPIFSYHAHMEQFERRISGNHRLAIGRCSLKSQITTSEKQFSFVAVYLGQQNLLGNISADMDLQSFEQMKEITISTFSKGSFVDVTSLMQTFFGAEKFGLSDLFYDEKRRILNLIAAQQSKEMASTFRKLYNDNDQLMNAMLDDKMLVPDAFRTAAEFTLNSDLKHFFEQEELHVKDLELLLGALKRWNITVKQETGFGIAASQRIFSEINQLESDLSNLQQLDRINQVLEILSNYEFKVELRGSQNTVFRILNASKREGYPELSQEWKEGFQRLAWLLNLKF